MIDSSLWSLGVSNQAIDLGRDLLCCSSEHNAESEMHVSYMEFKMRYFGVISTTILTCSCSVAWILNIMPALRRSRFDP